VCACACGHNDRKTKDGQYVSVFICVHVCVRVHMCVYVQRTVKAVVKWECSCLRVCA